MFYSFIWSLFCGAVLSVISSFAIISLGCLKIALNVMLLLVLCVTSSRYNGLVCSEDCGISWPYSTDFFHAILNS